MGFRPGLSQSISTAQKQVQRQVLIPRQLQAIEVLQRSTAELEALVNEKLQDNPALSLAGDGGVAAEAIKPEGAGEDRHGQEDLAAARDLERKIDFIESNNDGTFGEQVRRRASLDGEDGNDKMEALANAPDRGITLQGHLLGQLSMFSLEPKVRAAAERIIEALDGHGLLSVTLEQVMGATAAFVDDETAEAALSVVQGLEPTGVGARSTAEALLLQIDPADQDYGLYRELLTRHWDDFLKRRFPKIARSMGVSVDDISFAAEQIATLNPWPGREFDSAAARTIVPDIIIEERPDLPGEYQIQIPRDRVPRLRLSRHYARLLETTDDPKTKAYLREKIDNARALIEAMAQRQSTLRRVAEELLRQQPEFLEYGVAGLKPLKMQDLADEIGVHVSTICRAVAEKYVDTPQGVYPLRYFFAGGTESDDGATSSHAVKEYLRQMVEGEDRRKPLSDAALAKLMKEKHGISLARRTVAKYRDELNIADSRQRRDYA